MAEARVFNLDSGITAMGVAQAVEGFFEDEKGLMSEIVETPQGIIIQAKQKDAWKKYVGMNNSVRVQIFDQETSIVVDVSEGEWIDKAGVAAVGFLVFSPLVVTAALGAWANKKLPDEIFDVVKRCTVSGGKRAGVSRRMRAALETSLEEKSTPQGEDGVEKESFNNVKTEMDLKILREKHQMEMEAKREAERQRQSEKRELYRSLGVCWGVLLLLGLVCFFAEHLFLLGGLIIVACPCVITALVLRHKRLMRQHDIDILKTNVSAMDDSEAERLAKKYQER